MPARKPETVLGVLRAAEGYLRERGVDAPRLSAELLIAHVLGLGRLELYLAHDRPVDEAERARLRPLVARRGRRVPLAYLLGAWGFDDVELRVTPDVLVPRPETEGLVELARQHAAPGARCVDLGTGSGAIAIALAAGRPDVTVWAVDVVAAAVALARENAERNGVAGRVRVVAGSYWEPLRGERPFDLLVSNPPYVDPARPELLATEVREHEPAAALFTRPGDPCSAYRTILAGVPDGVRSGGRILLETGAGAAEPALELLRAARFLREVELRHDPAGLPRYLLARVA